MRGGEDLQTKASDFLNGLINSAGKTKKEFLDSVSSEMITKVVDKIDPRVLLDEVLTRYDIEFKIKVSLSPKDRARDKKARE